jgi:hypothetical protein
MTSLLRARWTTVFVAVLASGALLLPGDPSGPSPFDQPYFLLLTQGLAAQFTDNRPESGHSAGSAGNPLSAPLDSRPQLSNRPPWTSRAPQPPRR